MTLYSALASLTLVLHLLFIIWVVLGAFLTHDWPRLGWLHIASLVWGLAVEVLPWPCPLTLAENWLQGKAGLIPYQGGFLLYYLDALVYPNVSPRALTAGGVVIWLVNLAIYTVRFRPRHSAGR